MAYCVRTREGRLWFQKKKDVKKWLKENINVSTVQILEDVTDDFLKEYIKETSR